MATEPVQRCARVNFKGARTVRDGVGYVGFVSAHRTQVNNAGGCKRICADLVLDPGRGVFGLMIRSDDKVCFGGFANIGGKVTGALRGVLAGHIVIFFSVSDCDPAAWAAARGRECDEPPAAPHYLCYQRPDGWECIYCVLEQEAYRIRCTFEQDATTRPCDSYGTPGGFTGVLPIGASVKPSLGMEDIYGNGEMFEANDARTGLVKYYLQPTFGGLVNPLWLPPGYETFCHHCNNWMCFWVKHNLGSGELNDGPAWGMHCTAVIPREGAAPANEPQACCYEWFGQMQCRHDLTPDACRAIQGTPMGPGTTCDLISCSPLEYGACCLPDGNCLNVTREICETVFGGTFVSQFTDCANESCPQPDDPNLAWREVLLRFQELAGIVQFDFSLTDKRCFRLYDQYCLSSGPDSDCSGQPCWDHVGHGNIRQLQVLDRIYVDFSDDFGWAVPQGAGDDRYPHAEPEYVRIANAAFGLLNQMFLSVNNHPRESGYDRSSLNQWWEQQIYDCLDPQIPIVRGADGEPWPVFVVPYRTRCAYPAELVVRYARVHLWLSGDPGNTDLDGNVDDIGKVRVLATFKVQMQLDVRLKLGWEDVDCPVGIAPGLSDRCSPVFEEPDRLMLFTSAGSTRIPRELHWAGIHGPRPWSKGPFGYEQAADVHGLPCCTFICGIDRLVIPAEVDDTGDPDAVQRYAGDVVLLTPEGRTLCNCVN